jgi:benzodiazapine receptor
MRYFFYKDKKKFRGTFGFIIFVTKKNMQRFLRISVAVMTCLVVGYLSGMATKQGIDDWYPTLNKPFFNPPNWIFAPVWTLLYVGMGVAAGLVWTQMEKNEALVKRALFFFTVQLALNALWSFLFFSLWNPLLALLEIIVLELMIYETYVQFKKINRWAGFLLIPYLAWVGFATLLNGAIWWLN